MTNSQVQNSSITEETWTEIIGDLWIHLPHFQKEERLYDDRCLKIDCAAEESESDDETWPHKSTPDMEDTSVEVNQTKEQCELTADICRT